MKEKLAEGYYSMGKKASYNDAVPNVKIVIQHSRALEEGEQRYRNVAKIFLENVDGERFLAPTTRPGLARVYARHIAEGGVPNDERWGHIKSICEDYNKMAGFVRATRGKQFNESAQSLINEGVNHYTNLRETLSRMTGHRGYNAYFESWTPALMEDEGDDSINELFVQETVDPRIESVMPILSRLRKNVSEVKEVDALAEWAESVINEKLVEMDDEIDDAGATRYDPRLDARSRATNFAKSKKNPLSKLDPETVTDLLKFGVIMSEEELEEDESLTSNNPQGIPEGDELDRRAKLGKNILGKNSPHAQEYKEKNKYGDMYKIGGPKGVLPEEELDEDLDANQKRVGQLGPYEKVGPKGAVGKLVGGESKQHNDTPLIDKEDYKEKRKTLQKIQMDPDTPKDPKLADELSDRLHRLDKQAKEKGLAEGEDDLARLKSLIIR